MGAGRVVVKDRLAKAVSGQDRTGDWGFLEVVEAIRDERYSIRFRFPTGRQASNLDLSWQTG